MKSGADISECGLYRYRLWRRWKRGDSVLWIMLNPSTADAEQDDPTIRRCISFAESWGCGGIEVVNLFALRATDPKELKAAEDPIGPQNDDILLSRAEAKHRYVIAAWGAHGKLFEREKQVVELLAGMDLYCLGLTKAGYPRHPLYLPKKAEPTIWEAE